MKTINTELIPGTKAVAQRIVNAQNNFIEYIVESHGKSQEEAEKVFRIFTKLKLIKLDAVGGRYHVKHGAYFDTDAINNAIAYQEH